MTTYDKIAAASIAAVLSVFPVLTLIGAVSVSAETLAAVQVSLGLFSTLGGLIFQAFQHKA